MTNLLWPGDHRAGDLMTDYALLEGMVAVESAWLRALIRLKVAPPTAADDLSARVDVADCQTIAAAAEAAGNPILALIGLLRQRGPSTARQWIHRGLTSQDVIDSALVLAIRAVVRRLSVDLAQQISALIALATKHRETPMVARTLTQHAVPTTFGAKAATWLVGVIDAHDHLIAVRTPIQIGGAAGTLAATTELARIQNLPGDPAQISIDLSNSTAETLGLQPSTPWHTNRTPLTAAADAIVACTDAWGHIAADVLTLSRPEIGEISEAPAAGRGASSTMPQKRNPVLSILIRRTAITAPELAATLHTAAALAHDERPDGAWHAEWDTLRTLARRTVVASSQCSELLSGLQIHPEQMRIRLDDSVILAEQQQLAGLVEKTPSVTYFGAVDRLIDTALARAHTALKEKA